MAKFVAVLGSSSLHSAHNSNTSVEYPCTSWAKNNAREAWHKFCLLPDDHQLGDRVRLQVSHGVARRELRAVIWVWTTVYPLEPKCGTEFPQDLGSTVQSYTRTAWLLYCHWEAPRTPGTQLYRQGRGPCAVGRESSPFGLHPYQEGR